MLKYILVFVSTWTFVIRIYSYKHSSQISLRRMYDLQNEQFSVARDYLNLETERIQYLERKWISIFDWYVNNTMDKDYITINNSVWYLKLMQWIFSYSELFTSAMNDEQSLIAFEKFNETKVISEFDLQSVAQSLRRIQRVYAIPASNMADGRYRDRTIGDQMNACECYVMTKYCFEDKDLYSALDWAIQTHNKWLDDRPKCVDTEKLDFYIKSVSASIGFNFETLPKFNELHQSDNSKKFTDYFSLMANETFVQDMESLSDIFDTYYDCLEMEKQFQNFQKLCRTGKSIRPITNNSKCRYQTKNSPYRILIPFKEEDISINPDLKLYHDLLYDDESITLMKMAEYNLTDALVNLNGKSGLSEETRSSQLRWLSDDSNHELFGKLNERVECLTGYSTSTAEAYQTVNYGVGGHFNVHLDAFSDGPKANGNRLATVLFYMTDVPDDGYTVFPNLNYVAHCKKGTALVWTNLHLNNGSINFDTFHGGCPIIKGNKWITTKFLCEKGQPIKYNWEANKK